jgi:hypothetical protein
LRLEVLDLKLQQQLLCMPELEKKEEYTKREPRRTGVGIRNNSSKYQQQRQILKKEGKRNRTDNTTNVRS